jgi:hypothetical protein
VAWPAFAVLVATGVWMLTEAGESSDAFKTTLMTKLTLVLVSGIGVALHSLVKNPTLKAIWATVGFVSALGVVLLGVSIVEAG